MSNLALEEVYDPTKYINPFLIQGKPKRGQPFTVAAFETLPSIVNANDSSSGSILSSLPSTPGHGCFVNPYKPLGLPLALGANCDRGFWCPYVDPSVPSRQMVACPPTDVCASRRILGAKCMPQGLFEPVPCLAGYYCPDPQTILPCPEGYQCTTGTHTPVKCQFMSRCPSGTIIETHFGFFFFVIVIDVLLFALIIGRRVFELKRARLPLTALLPASIQKLVLKRSSSSKPSAEIQLTDMENSGGNIDIQDADDLDSKKAIAAGKKSGEFVAGANNAAEAERLGNLVDVFKMAFDGHENLKMEFKFEDLGLKLPNGKSILQGVTGEIKSGRMTAIMGPSGAGSE
ncbi:hypothetical protein HDU97_006616 [Phlyctochytrium planicorne]|nr:hypothetical protein HDU97_006616 [Phlyctochytrium planicorne]